MRAQCRIEYISSPGIDAKTGKTIGMDNRLTSRFPVVNADQIDECCGKLGRCDFEHSVTGALS